MIRFPLFILLMEIFVVSLYHFSKIAYALLDIGNIGKIISELTCSNIMELKVQKILLCIIKCIDECRYPIDWDGNYLLWDNLWSFIN